MTAGKMIGMALVLLFTAATPLGLMAWLHKKRGGRWLSFLIGALFFPVFAMMLEPLLHIVALKSPLGAVMQNNIWVFGLYGGLAAGRSSRKPDGWWPSRWYCGTRNRR